MDSFLTSALSAIGTAASNPLALFAYLALIGAWLLIALRVSRYKQLLSRLDKLPPKDRLQALRDEMGGAYLKSGVSADEWLHAKQEFYYFIAC